MSTDQSKNKIDFKSLLQDIKGPVQKYSGKHAVSKLMQLTEEQRRSHYLTEYAILDHIKDDSIVRQMTIEDFKHITNVKAIMIRTLTIAGCTRKQTMMQLELSCIQHVANTINKLPDSLI